MSFIDELKRRNVFKVGIAYVVVAWLVIQVLEIVLDSFGSPDWVMKTMLVILATGFPFALIFAWAFELTPEGLKKEKDVDRSKSITQTTGRKLDYTIIAVLVVALGYFAYDKFVLGVAREAALIETVQGEQQTEADSELKTIAVLPFVNMSSDAEQEYFSDGISEEILNSLARVKNLQVSGRTSSFAFKGQNQDLRQIGEVLGVDHILEGSVRKSGNTVRITAQLINVNNGFHLWSDTYDRELDNVFAIQDEIAAAILHELKATLLDGESAAPKVARTNSETYDLHLLAKQRIYERTNASIAAAADLLDRAIASDPDYAPAYAQRGIVALLMRKGQGWYGDLPLKQAQAAGKLYLDKALQLSPDLAEAWAGMGLYYHTQPGSNQQAIETLNKALDLNPGMIDASNWLNNALMAAARPREASEVLKKMMLRDPLFPPGIGNIVISLVGFGESEEAQDYLDRIQPQVTDIALIEAYRAYIKLLQGHMAEALETSNRALAVSPSNGSAHLVKGWALLGSGQYQEAITHGSPVPRLVALIQLGRIEEAAMAAYEMADKEADVQSLFAFLNLVNRSDELIEYLEARWPNLDALQTDFPAYGTLGYDVMVDVALAYSRAGNAGRFDDAMARVSKVHEQLLADGAKNSNIYILEASRLALAGDYEASLDFIERSVDQGLAISGAILADDWAALEILEGDPRYEAIQARLVDHLNNERQKLGLEPLSI